MLEMLNIERKTGSQTPVLGICFFLRERGRETERQKTETERDSLRKYDLILGAKVHCGLDMPWGRRLL